MTVPTSALIAAMLAHADRMEERAEDAEREAKRRG